MTHKRKGRSRKSERKIRIDFRRNRARPARDKDWTRRLREGDIEAEDARLSENVVAKGDLSRKRTVIERENDEEAGVAGVVVAMRGLVAEVDDGTRVWPCTVRRKLRTRLIEERNPVTVGDRVRFTIEADEQGVENEGVIEAVEPRRGVLTRIVGKRVQTIVANVDQVIIVSAVADPEFKPHLVDRYIVAAHAGGVEPVICLNKQDLPNNVGAVAELEHYSSLGYRTLKTSAKSGLGIDYFRTALAGRCSAVAGQSGVGKSSLLNAVDPRLNLRVGEVSAETQKGRHVTTTATLIRLADDGYVVDTPGVRSFDISTVPAAEIELHFVEFAEHIPHCKFPDCTHRHETGCAVKAAVDSDHISTRRYESYCRMFEERITA